MARDGAILGLSERCPKSCLHIQLLWLLGIGHLGFVIHAGSGSSALGHHETVSPLFYGSAAAGGGENEAWKVY